MLIVKCLSQFRVNCMCRSNEIDREEKKKLEKIITTTICDMMKRWREIKKKKKSKSEL